MKIVKAVTSPVADNNVSTTLLAANNRRVSAVIYNDSTAVLYLKYGATASTTDFTYYIMPGGHWEMPPHISYQGDIDGIWSANASGSARITELVA